jgi:hypothetical protein
MADLVNVGVPQVANRGFVALALEAGIETTIRSLVILAMDKITLLGALKDALQVENAPLADALNLQTLDAILTALAVLHGPNAAIVEANQLPELVSQAGPASVSAARDGGAPTQVNVTYTEPPATFTAEIYLDGVFVKHSTAVPGGGFVNDFIANVPPGAHVVRVLYRGAEGQITRFGPLVNLS